MPIKDLFLPKWKQSDANVRLAAVRELNAAEQSEVLEDLAAHDADARVRTAAVERLTTPAALQRVAAAGPAADSAGLIQRRLDDFHRKQALAAPDAAAAAADLEAIANERVLVDVILGTPHPDVRRTALALVQSQDLIGEIILGACGKDVGLAALERVADERWLEKIGRSGSNSAVRRAARQRLAALHPPTGPSPAEQREAKLTAACQHAEEVQSSWNFEPVGRLLAADRQVWAELDPTAAHPLAPRFQAALAKFDRRRAEFEGKQAEERRRSEAEQQLRAEKERLCETYVTLDPGQPDGDEQSRALEAAWAALARLPEPGESDCQRRFATAREKFARGVAQVKGERACFADLEKQVLAAEALAASTDGGALRRRLPELKWSAPEFKLLDVAPLQQRFAAALAAARERLETQRREHDEQQRQRLARLDELLAQVEAQAAAANRPAALDTVRQAQHAWQELQGQREDKLAARFRQALDAFYEKHREYREDRQAEEWLNKELKEELIRVVEACAANNDLPAVAKIVQEAQQKWKAIGPVPRADSEPMWQRFHTAGDTAFGRCKAFFDAQRQTRAANLEQAFKLCADAEAVKDSGDWRATGERLKALQAQWKELGPLPKDENRTAYERFRRACNDFFERRRVHFEAVDAKRDANQQAKEDLIARVEALATGDGQHHAGDCLTLQEEYQRLGPARHQEDGKLWERLRAACDRFFARLDDERRENQQLKEALCAEVEALVAGLTEQSDRRAAANRIADCQRRWKHIGPARKDVEGALWQRFRAPCDRFFAERRQYFDALADERERHLAMKEDLVAQAESMVDSTDWRETAEALKRLQQQWRDIGAGPRDKEQDAWGRFHAACEAFFQHRNACYEKQDRLRLANLKRKEELLAELAMLVGGEDEDAATPKSGALSLAEELTLALEANFARRSIQADIGGEVRRLQDAWRAVGPVPREFDRPLWTRYKRLLDKYYGDRRRDTAPPPREEPRDDARVEPVAAPHEEPRADARLEPAAAPREEPVAAPTAPAPANATAGTTAPEPVAVPPPVAPGPEAGAATPEPALVSARTPVGTTAPAPAVAPPDAAAPAADTAAPGAPANA